MYGIQNVAKIAPKIVANVASQPARTLTYIASKPRERMSKAEKYVLGLILVTTPLVIPITFAMNFNKWRTRE